MAMGERHLHGATTSLDAFANNLPVQLTSFVGREVEIARVRQLVTQSRLVTLTGSGGVGKTRLALQVAADALTAFPAGIWLVELAPLSDAALVPVTMARTLGLPDEVGRSALQTIAAFIAAQRTLVVLDNCEHLLDGCAIHAEDLLRACPALVILATSREPLGAAGETIWRVPSLPADEAVGLFADRAAHARPDLAVAAENADAVAEICSSLDGIPLAIELAAARLRAFSPAEIAAGLHDRFRLLTGGSRTAVRRQQTLEASMDWSHDLLPEPERLLFRRLAVFAGGFDLDAADAVSAREGLASDQVPALMALLVDKSLVATDETRGVTRYRLLETVRQYAAEKLAVSGEADRVRSCHRDYYAALAARLHPVAGDRRPLIKRLDDEFGNLRAAFEWSLEQLDTGTALRLACSLYPLWLARDRMSEGLTWFDSAFADRPPSAQLVAPEVWVEAVANAAVLDRYSDNPGRRMTQATEAVALAREIGNPGLLARALHGAGCVADFLAADSSRYLAEASVLARSAGDADTLGAILASQAAAAVVSGDPVAARAAAEEGIALAGRTRNNILSRNYRVWLGWALVMQGDLRSGRSVLDDLVTMCEAARSRFWEIFGLAFLGWAHALAGHLDEARESGEASVALADSLGVASYAASGYASLAVAATAAGDADALRDITQEALKSAAGPVTIVHRALLAEADLVATDLTSAREHADHAVTMASTLDIKFSLMWALLTSARVAAAVGDVGPAHDDAYQALALGRDIKSKIGIIDAFELIGELARTAEDQHKAARLLGAADALRRSTCYRRFRLHQGSYEALVAELRASLGDMGFRQAFDAGATLTLDDAVSYALRGRGARSRPATGWPSLTPAELDVARLVAEGLANKEIAASLFVSPRTVQTHLTHIYGKLGIASRVQLANEAARNL